MSRRAVLMYTVLRCPRARLEDEIERELTIFANQADVILATVDAIKGRPDD